MEAALIAAQEADLHAALGASARCTARSLLYSQGSLAPGPSLGMPGEPGSAQLCVAAFKRLARSLDCYEACVALIDMSAPELDTASDGTMSGAGASAQSTLVGQPFTWRLAYANELWQRTTGLARSAALHKSLGDLMPGMGASPGLEGHGRKSTIPAQHRAHVLGSGADAGEYNMQMGAGWGSVLSEVAAGRVVVVEGVQLVGAKAGPLPRLTLR